MSLLKRMQQKCKWKTFGELKIEENFRRTKIKLVYYRD